MIVTFLLMLLSLICSARPSDPCASPFCKSSSGRNGSNWSFRNLNDKDFSSSSVAPWNLEMDRLEGREPNGIENAVCKVCTVDGLVPKPINIQIQVYHKRRNTTNAWCMCPYTMTVGCTCATE